MGFFFLCFKHPAMNNITGLIFTAVVATIGVIKFKLIEELVKKITSNDEKSRAYAILLLFSTVVVLTFVSLSLEPPQNVPGDEIVVEDKPDSDGDEVVIVSAPKTDLEVKVDVVKEGVELTEKLVSQAKENKRIKDSAFVADRKERWVYRIGDWTSDDEKILDTHKRMLSAGNLKVIKQRRKFLLIKEDYRSKDELEASLQIMQSELNGLSVEIIDLNQFLTRKRDQFSTSNETFRANRKKLELECLEAD